VKSIDGSIGQLDGTKYPDYSAPLRRQSGQLVTRAAAVK
jgi:hypothetical protein